jgi:hypothetical protein
MYMQNRGAREGWPTFYNLQLVRQREGGLIA